jgi:phosphoserine phosphatase
MRLFLFDVDSTLINEEVIELIAAHAGVDKEVAQITERAMAGELDFAASLKERVALLHGISSVALFDVSKKVTLTNGAVELIAAIQDAGDVAAVVSGGFLEVITPIMQQLGIKDYLANSLEIAEDLLTGKVSGKIIDREAKAVFLNELRTKYCPTQTIAVGDGANDIEMIKAADIGIAFCAKPALQAVADVVITNRDLREVLANL